MQLENEWRKPEAHQKKYEVDWQPYENDGNQRRSKNIHDNLRKSEEHLINANIFCEQLRVRENRRDAKKVKDGKRKSMKTNEKMWTFMQMNEKQAKTVIYQLKQSKNNEN